ncbi:3057_t:CDS:2, partial [Gigaspora margarita]
WSFVMERSANLNLRDQNNQTPLHRCVVHGYYHCLCSRSVTPNVANKVKNTPLLLIENGGDITLENAEKKTSLNLCKKGVKSFYFTTNFNRGINSC